MMDAVKLKVTLGILAALVVIGAAIFRIERNTARQAAIAQQQQREQEQIRKDDEAFRRQVEEKKKKSHAYAGNESKTWQTYQP